MGHTGQNVKEQGPKRTRSVPESWAKNGYSVFGCETYTSWPALCFLASGQQTHKTGNVPSFEAGSSLLDSEGLSLLQNVRRDGLHLHQQGMRLGYLQ
eukprot:09513_1